MNSTLLKLLALPESWDERERAWPHLLKTAFGEIQKVVQHNHALDWHACFQLLEEWETNHISFIKPEAEMERAINNLEALKLMVWSGKTAVSPTPLTQETGFGEAFIDGDYSDWLCGCIRTLRDGPYADGKRRLDVPIALYDYDEARGILATLQLELLAKGNGRLFHHPEDVFTTNVGPQFRQSMKDAFQITMAYVAASGEMEEGVNQWDGRWRIQRGFNGIGLPEYPPDVEEPWSVNGRSASAAAAWGWWFVMQNKVPDDGIIVMAQADQEGNLSGIERIREKVKAVISWNKALAEHVSISTSSVYPFDTIVVANETNQNQADNYLGPIASIHVRNLNE